MELYDYIVVGGGSAGCVVASRLSENPDCRVLLIEAGPARQSFWIRTPAGVGKLFANEHFNWKYTTEPVATAAGRQIYWPRGKVLGGTSAINGMIYMRGHPADYDEWAAQGNAGWDWTSVLPYFLKSESNARGASAYHGANGPLRVSDPAVTHPTTDAFIEAAVRVGIPRSGDLNAPPHEGVNYQQFTIRNGVRDSTYAAFLKPVLKRPNLTVMSDTRVLRVVFEGQRASGVEILQNGGKRTIHALREIVLSAGSLNSPHLLNLSGIGDGTQLQRFGIDVISNLPGVGQRLRDHWFAPFLIRVTKAGSYNANLFGFRKYLEGIRYLLTRSGYLALGSSAVSAYVKSVPERAQSDLQLVMRAMTFQFDKVGNPVVDRLPGLSGAVTLVKPASTGHIVLQSPDPLKAPAFHPNYLAEDTDVARVVQGMRLMRKILAEAPLAERIVAELSPGPEANTDEQLADHVRQNGNCAWHQVGGCCMGADELSVVDARLRVKGVDGLRVADASVMPDIIMGNTNAPAIMIGEKVAEMLREDKSGATV